MKKQIDIVVSPEIGLNEFELRNYLANKLQVSKTSNFDYQITKRSIDARSAAIKIRLSVNTFINEKNDKHIVKREYNNVSA